MTQYFIRYSDSEQWLQDDAKRGYSFAAYKFDNSIEELLEEEGYDLDEYDIDDLAERLNVREHSNGTYGFALNGLCGYGPFESIEEALEESRNGSYGAYTVCGIYEGYDRGFDEDLAQLFTPVALVQVFDTQEVTA